MAVSYLRWSICCLVAGLIPAAGGLFAADEWPQFRGPDGQGHAVGGRVPDQFSDTRNVVWKRPIPGRGWSSPVISDGICWMTTAITTEATPERIAEIRKTRLAANPLAAEMEIIDSVLLRAVSVDLATGRILQEIDLLKVSEPEPVHSLNSYASPSPILHAGRLYCHFGNLGTACVDTSRGEVLWTTRIPVEHSVGPGSTPVLQDDLLIIPCDGTDHQSVVALHGNTGEVAWKANRPPMSGENGDFHKAFSTPLVIHDGRRHQVVAPGAQWVVAYEPQTGKTIWQVNHGAGFSNSPRPVYAHGLVYVCTGYMAHELVAIRVDGTGDVTKTHVAWRINKQVPPMSSPVVVGDYLYMVSDQGVVSCVDARTGDVQYRERIAGNHSASPLAIDDKILFCSRAGEVTVIAAGPKFKLLATNPLEGQLMASPAVYRDSLIFRTDKYLYRISDRASARR